MPPQLPRFPPLPPSPFQPIRQIIKDGRQQLEKVRDEIRSIADELKGTVIGEAPKKPLASETKTEEKAESSAVSPDLTELKEYLERRKVEKALTELEKDEGDKEKNLEMVKKYIEGEDID